MAKKEGDDSCLEVLDPLTRGLDGKDIIDLHSQLNYLQIRVTELELENARLLSQISNCRCQQKEPDSNHVAVSSDNISRESVLINTNGDVEGQASGEGACEDEKSNTTGWQEGPRYVDENTKEKSIENMTGCKLKTMHHHAKRYVALKVMYLGQRFYGFASEAQMDPTIESEIFKALKRTMLLVGDNKELQYSRCGRTDKGVSSVGQVVALFLRSKLKGIGVQEKSEENFANGICEIDYVKALNRVLPKDIRVLGWSPAPTDFHARFSCIRRKYKYLFWKENLNISAMEIAGEKFVGEHDFRNFCKMDAVNVHNYRRHISSFEISVCNERSDGDQIWAMTIKGSAFLWHQVRCMVAVLFMIGRGLESPSVIDALLDTVNTPRKPQYTMASELPLILHSCEFGGLQLICSPDARRALYEHFKREFQAYSLQAAIFQEALLSCSSVILDESSCNDSKKKKKAIHIPLMSRQTEPSYEERCAKLELKTQQ